jgi:membrane associated rhomboid family serine protease
MSTNWPARPSARSGLDRRKVAGGWQLLAVLVGLMWVSELVDTALNNRLDEYGILSRSADGLPGVVAAPFLHLGFGHLIANTLPLIMLGGLIAFSGARRLLSVTVIVVLVGGIGTWLVSPPNTITIGASGLVFGYAAYLISLGLFTRRIGQILVGVVVVLVWGGGLLTGLVPQDGVSWQGHLFGAIAGVLAAWVLKDKG